MAECGTSLIGWRNQVYILSYFARMTLQVRFNISGAERRVAEEPCIMRLDSSLCHRGIMGIRFGSINCYVIVVIVTELSWSGTRMGHRVKP